VRIQTDTGAADFGPEIGIAQASPPDVGGRKRYGAHSGRFTAAIERRMGISTMRGSTYAYLDGVRAVAVVMVVVVHCWGAAGSPQPRVFGIDLSFIPGAFWMGVDLFFVLSGFLLARPWFQAELDGSPRPTLFHFWKRRLRRIGPAYYFSVVMLLFLFVPIGLIPHAAIEGRLGIFNLGSLLLFLQTYVPISSGDLNGSNPALWSLTVEITWYVVLPLAVVAFTGWRWRVSLPAALAISIVWIAATMHSFDGIVSAMSSSVSGESGAIVGVPPSGPYMRGLLAAALPTYAFTFAIGVALARMVVVSNSRELTAHNLIWRDQRLAAAAFAVGLFVLVGTAYSISPTQGPRLPGGVEYLTHSAIALGMGLILYGVAFGPRVLRTPLEWLPVRFIGWVSYGIYLFHFPVLLMLILRADILSATRAVFVTLFGAVMVLSTIAATLSWLIIERPFLISRGQKRLGRSRWRATRSTVVAAALSIFAVASYFWVTRLDDHNPWPIVAIAHHRGNAEIRPLLRVMTNYTVDQTVSGAATTAEAVGRGIMKEDTAQVLSHCADDIGYGSVYFVGTQATQVRAAAFPCRDRRAANDAIVELVGSGTESEFRPPNLGTAIHYVFHESPYPSYPCQLHVYYPNLSTVVAIEILSDSKADALQAAEEVTSVATEKYPAE
jgi:peptidoglycan/LPS O-acetylase OafA/YrhL